MSYARIFALWGIAICAAAFGAVMPQLPEPVFECKV